MYKIQLPHLGIIPHLFKIIDVELDVRRHKVWLDGRQVRPYDYGAWKLICKFDGPYSCPCPDVENRLRVFDRCAVEVAA